LYRSVSAFAPVVAPMRCPWGQKAFSRYLGDDRTAWAEHDACELMKRRSTHFLHGILIDQGRDDKFLAEQLLPHEFDAACRQAGQPLTLRMQEGYDHGYYFISTFMQDHIAFHRNALGAPDG
jgi:S-formylglutathione hydrolase